LLYGSMTASNTNSYLYLIDKIEQFFATVDEVNMCIRDNSNKIEKL
jgi:hypothetical protein